MTPLQRKPVLGITLNQLLVRRREVLNKIADIETLANDYDGLTKHDKREYNWLHDELRRIDAILEGMKYR